MRFVLGALALMTIGILLSGCQKNALTGGSGTVTPLKNVQSVRLNFRYEPDVPAPAETGKQAAAETLNPAIQADFDQSRVQEVLDATITSPDSKRVLAVYHQASDQPSEFRLDMYSGDGKVLKRITPDAMAVHFRETIRWAPDSTGVAFVAMTRAQPMSDGQTSPPVPVIDQPQASDANQNAADANSNAATTPVSTPAAPNAVLTFRTEQIYMCGADGDNTRALTQNEGLIYFYYVWSPDSTMLAALAATSREWQIMNDRADLASEVFLPIGRPRLVERNGRERRLDDGLTSVHPVWSPDSSKAATAFDTQVRVYDAGGNPPTQAAIPVRNQLLISSQTYDRQQADKLNAPNSNIELATNSNSAPQPSTLPDPSTLVSFNPIINLSWPQDDILYLETAFVRRMKNEADSAVSFSRWHRLVFTPQPAAK